ncbi:NTPase [Candidatus Bathyarchaeota archaeon]|nr:NTPase [Candidatus Bathyarchaeota archaeon]
MQKRVLLITGNPGVGKTTLILKIVEALKVKGYNVGGMISREVRSCGTRVGFEIIDLTSNKHGWLAHVNQKSGPQVGKYHVNMNDLNNVGAEAILNALENCEVIAIDEVGPMELFSEKFKHAVEEAVKSGKLVLAVIHWKARDTLIAKLKARKDTETFTVTLENRDTLHDTILEKAEEFLAYVNSGN